MPRYGNAAGNLLLMKLLPPMPLKLPLLVCALAAALCLHPARADDLYQPAAGDFRPAYDRDRANKTREAWGGRNGYWDWVQTFYQGYTKRVFGMTIIRQPGWTATSRRLVAHVVSPPTRQEMTVELNTLGRAIAAEWAKDDRLERINTNDLRRWGDMTEQAGRRDSGSGLVLLATVRAIQTEVNRRLQSRP